MAAREVWSIPSFMLSFLFFFFERCWLPTTRSPSASGHGWSSLISWVGTLPRSTLMVLTTVRARGLTQGHPLSSLPTRPHSVINSLPAFGKERFGQPTCFYLKVVHVFADPHTFAFFRNVFGDKSKYSLNSMLTHSHWVNSQSHQRRFSSWGTTSHILASTYCIKSVKKGEGVGLAKPTSIWVKFSFGSKRSVRRRRSTSTCSPSFSYLYFLMYFLFL